MSDALVDALIGRGAVTRSQARAARAKQAQRGGRLMEHLLEAGCESASLYESLSAVTSSPLAPREALLRPQIPVGLGVTPREWLRLCAAPFGTDDDGHVLVAVADPADEPRIAELDLPHYVVHLAPARDILVALVRGFPELLPASPSVASSGVPVSKPPLQSAPPPNEATDDFDEATQAVDAATLSQASFSPPAGPHPSRNAPPPEDNADDFDEATQAVAAAELLQQAWPPSSSRAPSPLSSATRPLLSEEREDKTTVAQLPPTPPLLSEEREDKTTVAAPIPQSTPLTLSGQFTAASPMALQSLVDTTDRNTDTASASSERLFTSRDGSLLEAFEPVTHPASHPPEDAAHTEFNLGVLESPRTRAAKPDRAVSPAAATHEDVSAELTPSVLIDDADGDFDEKTLAAEGIGLLSSLGGSLPLQQLPTTAIPGPMTKARTSRVSERDGKGAGPFEEDDDGFDELSVGALLQEAQARMSGVTGRPRSDDDTEAPTLAPAIPAVAVAKIVNTQASVPGPVAPPPSLDLDVVATAPAQMVRRSAIDAFSAAVSNAPATAHAAASKTVDAPVPSSSSKPRSTSGSSAAAVVVRGYEVLDVLGAGGMATVYRAMQRSAGREVALKVLSPQLSSDVAFVARFQREIRASASLTHRNVIRVYDYGDEDGVHYMATEIMDGGTLREAMHEVGALPAALAVKFMEHLLRGIGSAHGNGMVHRDIKPGNLMLSSDGSLKIGDFGIAKSETDESLTKTGALFGTPAYMSPEQTVGRTLDARSDLFSCGIILYEMLSGENPYQAENASASLLKVSRALTPPLLLKAPATPPVVLDVLERLQKRDAAERFGSATEALAPLAPLIEAIDKTWPTLVEDF
ncbi:MAG: protein kinase domain-containing protein, partial [Myxococcota bacterium]